MLLLGGNAMRRMQIFIDCASKVEPIRDAITTNAHVKGIQHRIRLEPASTKAMFTSLSERCSLLEHDDFEHSS